MGAKFDLCGSWKMLAICDADYVKLSAVKSFSSYDDVISEVCMDAKVPGNFELDLLRENKLLPEEKNQDPFYGMNPIKMQKYETYHVIYAKKFNFKKEFRKDYNITFEGIDTAADIYFNKKFIGKSDNMLITQNFCGCELADGENEIVVHIKPATIEARNALNDKGKYKNNYASPGSMAMKYNYESLYIRKAPHMFGWDIMPRLVSAGIYRPVYIEAISKDYIRQAYLMTTNIDAYSKWASMELFYDFNIEEADLSGCFVRVYGKCGDSTFETKQKLWFVTGKAGIWAGNIKPWWPKGYGNADLYEVRVELLKGDEVIDSKEFRTGLRTVKLVRTSTTDIHMNGKFQIEVNGKKIFISGSNWVPVDAYHSRDVERIPKIMELVGDIGVNCLRCWGGNVYEDEIFYSLCDENGILVWQDFAMACCIYPNNDAFLEKLGDETLKTVRKLRQHPSIALWSGDNECDIFMRFMPYGRNANTNKVTRETIPDIIMYEDPVRSYIPSSPYIDEEAWKMPDEYLTENHLWGPRNYFRGDYYGSSLCNFASEMGYHGCTSEISIKKFISPEKLWPWNDNDEWLVHAASMETDRGGSYIYRIELMAKQIKELFGYIPDNLSDFVLASQISQAEAKKYFVELFRSGQPKRTGIIWWNLIDGWPQFSDAVVDYYYEKKLAYHYIKNSQQPFTICATDSRGWELAVKAVNMTQNNVDFTYKIKDFESGDIVRESRRTIGAEDVMHIENLPYSQGEKRIYIFEWECDELSGKSHYLCGNPPFDFTFYKRFLAEFYGLR